MYVFLFFFRLMPSLILVCVYIAFYEARIANVEKSEAISGVQTCFDELCLRKRARTIYLMFPPKTITLLFASLSKRPNCLLYFTDGATLKICKDGVTS